MRINLLACAFLVSSMGPLNAGDRISLEGNIIRYDGNIDDGTDQSEGGNDANLIRELLRSHPDIWKIVLTGSFVATNDGLQVACIIDDFGLDTEVEGKCSHACIYMFVSGKPKILGSGAMIGLRRRAMDANRLRETFTAGAENFGWADEFGQAAMMYDRGQSDMRWALLHLVQHGVSLDFALKIFSIPREDMWWPTREELVEGGVITEAAK